MGQGQGQVRVTVRVRVRCLLMTFQLLYSVRFRGFGLSYMIFKQMIRCYQATCEDVLKTTQDKLKRTMFEKEHLQRKLVRNVTTPHS